MSEQEYSGWKNYETWAVSMYLDGNYTGPHTPDECIEIVKNHLVICESEDIKHPTIVISDALEDFVDGEIYGENASMGIAGDLLGNALGRVDWLTLAKHKIKEARESE